ncbi:hypothetical protein [Amycolatopsis vastitatis]|uniref:hypothetical protein n=1 Tax=Amycolatopsis vastitatis TaxID=1905142 RepID=UPI000B8AA558|nr:hypothetical protein [Amycolatopsis vastitatis]
MENDWRPDAVDEDPDGLAAILDSLGQDPAVKLTDSGRALLRWLASHALSPEDTDVFDAVPPQYANLVADIARRNAAIWQELANIVERLSREAT